MFAFTVTTTGRVDYDPSLDGILSGRGTSPHGVVDRILT
jgi:hypothetical protein